MSSFSEVCVCFDCIAFVHVGVDGVTILTFRSDSAQHLFTLISPFSVFSICIS